MSEPLPDDGTIAGDVRMVVFDFDGVFTDNTVWSDAEGGEWVRCWRGDGLGLSALRRAAVPSYVLSTETHPVVARRCAKLGIPCRQGLERKDEALRELAAETGTALDAIAYVGNDINDAECLKLVGVPIVVSDAHPAVVSVAKFQTRARGGFGAVREVCDWICARRGQA